MRAKDNVNIFRKDAMLHLKLLELINVLAALVTLLYSKSLSNGNLPSI